MKKKQNERQDHFFKEAKKQGYPARSVYKLKEIDQKFKLIKKGDVVLDLGCAPGSWIMYISEKVGHRGRVFGIDIQDMKIKTKENVEFIKEDARKAIKDIRTSGLPENLDGRVKVKKFDVVVSDMAPKTTGIKLTDVVRSLELAEEAFKIAQKTLKIKGHFVVKIFESEDTTQFVNMLKKYFNIVKRYNPQATRKQSREFYIVCKNRKTEEPFAMLKNLDGRMKDKTFFKKETQWLLNEKYNGKITWRVKKGIKKLEKGYPLAYLIGNQPFLNCKIDLRHKPLIPRPETEYWTEKVIDDIKKNKKRDIKCLDIFAGSGCIGIAILKHIEYVRVDFGEVNKKFLEQIRINLKINNIHKKRYCLISSDIFKSVDAGHLHDKNLGYDYILANPPYIPEKDKKLIQNSVIDHEPFKTLFAGKDGLLYIKQFLKKAKNYLNKNGKIYMEFGVGQKKDIEILLKNFKYKKYSFHKDQYGKWRWIKIDY